MPTPPDRRCLAAGYRAARWLGALGLCVAVAAAAAAPAGAAPVDDPAGVTLRVSDRGHGGEPNHDSVNPAVSADGRWVTFASQASNLVPDDTNHLADVFVRDMRTGTTTRVSVSSTGQQANYASFNPSISDDGRYVVFDSFATNLVLDDRNRRGDVFLHDRATAVTTRISRGIDGREADRSSGFAKISGDGSVIAFESGARNLRTGAPGRVTDIYLADRTGKIIDWVTRSLTGGEPNGGSGDVSLSRDGRVVAFASAASNLVPGDSNLRDDVFVRDRDTGITRRVSVSNLGAQGNEDSGVPSLSADGRYVAFASLADTLTGALPVGELPPAFIFRRVSVGDLNFATDIYVHDLLTRSTELVSVSTAGGQGSAGSYQPSISGDGRRVVFTTLAHDLVDGDTNNRPEVLLRDLTTRHTTRVSVGPGARQGNETSERPAISADGDWVVFSSAASNLVAGDRNRSSDVFAHRLARG